MIYNYPYPIAKPDTSEYPSYLKNYIQIAGSDEGFEALMNSATDMVDYLTKLAQTDLAFRYAPKKWSIQELILHIIDTERVFQTRALRIARNEYKALSGFDQDRYVKAQPPVMRSKESLIEEFQTVRKSTFLFYLGLPAEYMSKNGRVAGFRLTLNSFPFIIAGHDQHHLKILRERYVK